MDACVARLLALIPYALADRGDFQITFPPHTHTNARIAHISHALDIVQKHVRPLVQFGLAHHINYYVVGAFSIHEYHLDIFFFINSDMLLKWPTSVFGVPKKHACDFLLGKQSSKSKARKNSEEQKNKKQILLG